MPGAAAGVSRGNKVTVEQQAPARRRGPDGLLPGEAAWTDAVLCRESTLRSIGDRPPGRTSPPTQPACSEYAGGNGPRRAWITKGRPGFPRSDEKSGGPDSGVAVGQGRDLASPVRSTHRDWHDRQAGLHAQREGISQPAGVAAIARAKLVFRRPPHIQHHDVEGSARHQPTPAATNRTLHPHQRSKVTEKVLALARVLERGRGQEKALVRASTLEWACCLARRHTS